jgi:hypothetical protein
MAFADTAVMATGTSSNFSSRLRAVTVISSIPPPEPAVLWS